MLLPIPENRFFTGRNTCLAKTSQNLSLDSALLTEEPSAQSEISTVQKFPWTVSDGLCKQLVRMYKPSFQADPAASARHPSQLVEESAQLRDEWAGMLLVLQQCTKVRQTITRIHLSAVRDRCDTRSAEPSVRRCMCAHILTPPAFTCFLQETITAAASPPLPWCKTASLLFKNRLEVSESVLSRLDYQLALEGLCKRARLKLSGSNETIYIHQLPHIFLSYRALIVSY